jgi:hypothetical protein
VRVYIIDSKGQPKSCDCEEDTDWKIASGRRYLTIPKGVTNQHCSVIIEMNDDGTFIRPNSYGYGIGYGFTMEEAVQNFIEVCVSSISEFEEMIRGCNELIRQVQFLGEEDFK